MKKKKGSLETVKFVVVAIFLVAVVLIYFNHLGNRSSKRKEEATKTETDELETYDFISNYPKTPRDVVKMHCRFFKLMYGDGVSDDDLVILNQQVRNLYSQEILAFNTENDNLVNLKKNIQKYYLFMIFMFWTLRRPVWNSGIVELSNSESLRLSITSPSNV